MRPLANPVPPPKDESVLERGLRFTRGVRTREVAALRRLLTAAGSVDAALEMATARASDVTGEPEEFLAPLLAPLSPADLEEQASRMSRSGARVVVLTDAEYPRLLAETPDAPPALFVRGRPLGGRPAVAVVGARRASRAGLETAHHLGRQLAGAGVLVVSGFARGVDAAAHRGALETGTSLGVFGCGADVCYPTDQRRLLEALLAKGSVVSEFPMGTHPEPFRFPIRNRIIAGLSRIVVVVEAAERSGSLITARLAAEYGRDVAAVPGAILSPCAAGSNLLLKDGAILVRSVEDILRELPDEERALLAARSAPGADADLVLPEGLSADAVRLFGALDPDEPRDADALALAAGLPASRLSGALVALEIEGLLQALPGALFLRKRARS